MLKDLEKLLNNDDGNTLLHLAVDRQMEDAVKYLLEEKKMNPDQPNANGETPVHFAAKKPNTKITSMLIKKGGNVNARDKDGNTPLHIAAANGQVKQVKKLLLKGAEVNANNKVNLKRKTTDEFNSKNFVFKK